MEGINQHIPANEGVAAQNARERERAYQQSIESFKQRLASGVLPTDIERRVGIYKEMLEPQVRDALILLAQKGYVTIDSGYDARRVPEGVQYIGFRKNMIDEAALASLPEMPAVPELESDERSDYLRLIPKHFISLEAWKPVWDAVAASLPDRGEPAPIRENFIDSQGH